MKRKITTVLCALSILATTVAAQEVVTAGDKSVITFAKLAESDTTGVTRDGLVYTVTKNITISATDTLRIENNSTLKLGDDVLIKILGYGDFAPSDTATITRGGEASPKGIFVYADNAGLEARNVRFEYASLRYGSEKPLIVDNCTFENVTTNQMTTGVIAFAMSNSGNIISNCRFINCEPCAIGGAANFTNGVTFTGNYMEDCNTANANKPFINLTVGGNEVVEITGNTIIGAKRLKVGGIGVGNMMGLSGTNRVVVKNNKVRDCRYGITTIGAMNAVIEGNELIDNRYESNPNNGGSGISLYDTSSRQVVTMTGNTIQGSLWGVTVIYCKEVNMGKTGNKTAADYNPGLNVFKDNGNNGTTYDAGTPYDLYNNSTITVYAQGNTWSVAEQDSVSIEKVVFHKNDNAALGEVIFMPRGTSSVTAVEHDAAAMTYDRVADVVKLAVPATVEVYTLSGSKAMSVNATDEVGLSQLQSGIYIVRAKSSAADEVLKIVK